MGDSRTMLHLAPSPSDLTESSDTLVNTQFFPCRGTVPTIRLTPHYRNLSILKAITSNHNRRIIVGIGACSCRRIRGETLRTIHVERQIHRTNPRSDRW